MLCALLAGPFAAAAQWGNSSSLSLIILAARSLLAPAPPSFDADAHADTDAHARSGRGGGEEQVERERSKWRGRGPTAFLNSTSGARGRSALHLVSTSGSLRLRSDATCICEFKYAMCAVLSGTDPSFCDAMATCAMAGAVSGTVMLSGLRCAVRD
eukprot:2119244-Rhodomonas_salina.1